MKKYLLALFAIIPALFLTFTQMVHADQNIFNVTPSQNETWRAGETKDVFWANNIAPICTTGALNLGLFTLDANGLPNYRSDGSGQGYIYDYPGVATSPTSGTISLPATAVAMQYKVVVRCQNISLISGVSAGVVTIDNPSFGPLILLSPTAPVTYTAGVDAYGIAIYIRVADVATSLLPAGTPVTIKLIKKLDQSVVWQKDDFLTSIGSPYPYLSSGVNSEDVSDIQPGTYFFRDEMRGINGQNYSIDSADLIFTAPPATITIDPPLSSTYRVNDTIRLRWTTANMPTNENLWIRRLDSAGNVVDAPGRSSAGSFDKVIVDNTNPDTTTDFDVGQSYSYVVSGQNFLNEPRVQSGTFTIVAASDQFAIDDRVVTNATVNVRATANGAVIDTKQSGAHGTVIDGPIVAGGFTWWRIDYDCGSTGWSAENLLDKYAGSVVDDCGGAGADCGNNVIDTGEQCDVTVGTATCRSNGFTDGTLTCTANCTFNTTQCTGDGPDDPPNPGNTPGWHPPKGRDASGEGGVYIKDDGTPVCTDPDTPGCWPPVNVSDVNQLKTGGLGVRYLSIASPASNGFLKLLGLIAAPGQFLTTDSIGKVVLGTPGVEPGQPSGVSSIIAGDNITLGPSGANGLGNVRISSTGGGGSPPSNLICDGTTKKLLWSGTTWSCGDDIANTSTTGGTVTQVTAGAGLSARTTGAPGGSITTSGTIKIKNCSTAGQVLKWDTTNNDWDCETDLTGGGGNPGSSFVCDASNKKLLWDGSAWKCGNDLDTDTDTNTTYTADGATLQLSSRQFSIKDDGVTNAKLNLTLELKACTSNTVNFGHEVCELGEYDFCMLTKATQNVTCAVAPTIARATSVATYNSRVYDLGTEFSGKKWWYIRVGDPNVFTNGVCAAVCFK